MGNHLLSIVLSALRLDGFDALLECLIARPVIGLEALKRRPLPLLYCLLHPLVHCSMKVTTILLCLQAAAAAATLKGKLAIDVPATTRIKLSAPQFERESFVRQDGSFSVANLTDGDYLLRIICRTHHFEPLRVDIKEEEVVARQTFPGHEWNNAGPPLIMPLLLAPSQPAVYFAERQPFNVYALIKNPIVILGTVTLLMLVVMPRMVAAMDPEELKRFQTTDTVNPSIGDWEISKTLAGSSSPAPEANTRQELGAKGRKQRS